MDDEDLKKLALGKGIVPDCLLEQKYYFKHDKAKLKYRYPFPASLPSDATLFISFFFAWKHVPVFSDY